MKSNPPPHRRRSIRLKGYDYAQAGGYYITLVALRRECLFGEIVEGEVRLSPSGRIADECWRSIPEHFPNVELGAYVVMPNHIHGIIIIHEKDDRTKKHQPNGRPFEKRPHRPKGAKTRLIGRNPGSIQNGSHAPCGTGIEFQ